MANQQGQTNFGTPAPRHETNGADWPDPKSLPNELPAVAEFDPALLPEAFRPWVVDVAERMQCPIDFPAVAAIVALAGVVGRKIGIRPKQFDVWLVVSNLWGAIIGRPGILKTPAIQEPLKPLLRLEIEAKQEYDAAAREYEAAKMVADARRKVSESAIKQAVKKSADEALAIATTTMDEESKPPVRRRYLVNDSTVEKVGEILNQNPNGIVVFRDELVGFLRNLDKEGQEGARAFYLEAWNGIGRFTWDRIGRGTIDIEAAIVSVFGSIQPGPLGDYLRAAAQGGKGDDGLMQRFQLVVWPDVSKEWRNVDRWPDTAAKQCAYDVFTRLDNLDAAAVGAEVDQHDPDGIPYLRFADDAQVEFNRWREQLEVRLRSGEDHPAIESHLAKYRSLIPTLALLVHLADDGHGPVSLDALDKAICWGVYLESHARRIFSSAVNPALASARALATKIMAGDVADGFALRDVYRNCWSGLADSEEVGRAADVLVGLNWLREVVERTEGRNKTSYRINPKIHARPPKGTDKTDKRGFD